MSGHRRPGLLSAGVIDRQRSEMACRPWLLEKGGRRIHAHRGSEPMNQLPHTPVCITIFFGDVVLWKTFDEDGSQRLVLAVIGCRIGVQEKLSAASVIHDGPPPGVSWFSVSASSRKQYQKPSARPSLRTLEASESGKSHRQNEAFLGITRQGSTRIGYHQRAQNGTNAVFFH